jgi:hypothetical protein
MRPRRLSIRLNVPEWLQHTVILGILAGAAAAVFLGSF